jgi:hypothetical protein
VTSKTVFGLLLAQVAIRQSRAEEAGRIGAGEGRYAAAE